MSILRFMVTVHAAGIHVDTLSARATEQTPDVQYPDKNWFPLADYKLAGEVMPLLQRAQQDVGAMRAVKAVTERQDDGHEPPRAA